MHHIKTGDNKREHARSHEFVRLVVPGGRSRRRSVAVVPARFRQRVVHDGAQAEPHRLRLQVRRTIGSRGGGGRSEGGGHNDPDRWTATDDGSGTLCRLLLWF